MPDANGLGLGLGLGLDADIIYRTWRISLFVGQA